MKIRKMFNSKPKIIFSVLGITLLLIVIAVGIAVLYMVNYTDPQTGKLAKAGITEKSVQVGQVNFNYAEGPDNGPPLLLLHAQLLDWYTYNQVLPELSTKFHVYAVDYPGHGKTKVPESYSFNANQIGSDLGNFIKTVIREPVFVTGNSSGGLLTAWLAAYQPNWVKAIVLEDPPLFSSEYPEIQKTIAYKSFTTSHTAVENGYDGDFLNYWIEHSTQFFKTYTGPFTQQIIDFAVHAYRKANPGKPVEIAFLPDVVQELLRGLNEYDPRFGNAFYEGTWNEGFDHTEALQKIKCPTLLLHANYKFTEDGILDGAISQEQADRVVSLMAQGNYMKIDSAHVVNLEHPQEFASIVEDFFLAQFN